MAMQKKHMKGSDGTVYAKSASMTEELDGDVKLKAPHKQVGPTCWANAMATAIRSIESQIKYRHVQEHSQLVEYLVKTYVDKKTGKRPQTIDICKAECAKRHLRCKIVSDYEAVKAVTERAVIVSFGMDDVQWKNFIHFFQENKDGVFTKDVMNNGIQSQDITHRHAVCAIGYNLGKLAWKIQNSWGGHWGDGGFCFVQRGALPEVRFIDIYFCEEDLPKPPKNKMDFF